MQRDRLIGWAVVFVRVASPLAEFDDALLGRLAPLGELLGQVGRCHVAQPVQKVTHPFAPKGNALRLVHQLQELPRVCRKTFHVTPLAFGKNSIKSK